MDNTYTCIDGMDHVEDGKLRHSRKLSSYFIACMTH